ncbi:MAG: tRNA epoxyqueuosine(34) reductase QueG, partial [Pseudomonadota bacterium]
MLDQNLQNDIRVLAEMQGFNQIGFAPALCDPRAQKRLIQFINNGEHGDMEWMANTLKRRLSPQNMWSNAKTAIILAMSYAPDYNPLIDLKKKDIGVISVYARGDDYHDLIKKRLKYIARKIAVSWNGDVKVFVDTAPLMEKSLAFYSGLGWQGKHTNLISRTLGNWFFLGVILTNLELPLKNNTQKFYQNKRFFDGQLCGECTRCLDICPTDALSKPYQLNAKACISYLTIEHKGPIPIKYRKAIGNRIFGC